MLWALLIILLAAVILKKVWHKVENLEGFSGNVERSDNENVEEGASSLWNWGYPSKEAKKDSSDGGNGNKYPWHHWKPEHGRRHGGGDKKEKCIDVTDYDCRDIGKCPITLHPDITNYVLKSSVPPCPDLKNYVLKSEMPPNVDLDKYILKSEIPPCPKCPNLKDYIKKSEIPACPPRVKCPVCPICPRCPSDGGGGDGGGVDMNQYMLKSECRRLLREQARGNRQALRIQDRDSRRRIRDMEQDYNRAGGDVDISVGAGVGIGAGSGSDGGGFFADVMKDIKDIFGNGGGVGSSGSYGANGDYSGLTTQGLAVGDVYKKA